MYLSGKNPLGVDIGSQLIGLGFRVDTRGNLLRGAAKYGRIELKFGDAGDPILTTNRFGGPGGEPKVVDLNTIIDLSTISIGENDNAPILELNDLDGNDISVVPLDGLSNPNDASVLGCVELLYRLWPDIGNFVWYDELKQKARIDTALFGESLGIQPRTDAMDTIYEYAYLVKMSEMRIQTKVSRVNMLKALDYHIEHTRFNPWRSWLESLQWDGIPRIKTMFQDVFGATAPAVPPQFEDDYIGAVAQAWLLGAVYRAYKPTRHEVVPCLVGAQGIGKGLAIKWLSADDDWYIDTGISAEQFKEFLDGVRGRVVVELSEAMSIRTKEVDAIKTFISKTEDQMRKPYSRVEETFPRSFIMIATTNAPAFLNDITGNRRFYPLYCDPNRAKVRISTDRDDNYYPQQIWAETMNYYALKHPCFVDKRIQGLAETMQEFALIEDPNVLVIEKWLDDNHPGIGEMVTREEVIEYALHVSDGELLDRDRAAAYRLWSTSPRKWARVPYPLKVGGRSRRVFKRMAPPDTQGLYGFERSAPMPTLLFDRINAVMTTIHNPEPDEDNNVVEWEQ